MAQTKYTLVYEECDVEYEDSSIGKDLFLRAMMADSPVLRHLRPALPIHWQMNEGYHVINRDWIVQDKIGYSFITALTAAAVMELNAAYSRIQIKWDTLP